MQCKICKNRTRLPIHKFCSKECYWKYLGTLKGENAPNWKTGKIRKESVHQWLNANYGKPRICEIGKCTMESKIYDWALIKGKQYEKKRENFMRLCRSCHRRYDLTPQKKKQAIKNLMLHNPYKKDGTKSKYKKFLD